MGLIDPNLILDEIWSDETGGNVLIEVPSPNFLLSHCTRSNKEGIGVAEATFSDFLCKCFSLGSYHTIEYLILNIDPVSLSQCFQA